MIGKAIATAVIAVFLTTGLAFAQLGGAPGIGAPTSTLVPSPPRDVRATAGNGMATVSFAAPRTNGGSPVTVYTVTAYPGRIKVQGAKSPIVVGGLASGETYRFTVSASSSIGTGLPSGPSNPVTAR